MFFISFILFKLRFLEQEFILNPLKYILIFVIFFNIYLLYVFDVSTFDQILNLIISFGIFTFHSNTNYKNHKNLNIIQISSSFLILLMLLYRSFWLHHGDNFIYLLLPVLYLTLVMLYFPFENLFKNYKPLLISLLLPITKVIFIPLSIIFSPLSAFFTWLLLNAIGFESVLKGQEILYKNSGINVTFSCSGSGQILFCLSAMIILNYCFPLRSIRLLILQLFIASFLTFSSNIIRLFLLTLYVNTANSDGFSIFDYLHGGSGGLIFGFLSMAFSCESFKRIYYIQAMPNDIN